MLQNILIISKKGEFIIFVQRFFFGRDLCNGFNKIIFVQQFSNNNLCATSLFDSLMVWNLIVFYKVINMIFEDYDDVIDVYGADHLLQSYHYKLQDRKYFFQV